MYNPLVEVRVGDGVLVCASPVQSKLDARADDSSPLEQLEARSMLEGEVAALAARNIQPDQLNMLEVILNEMALALNDDARFRELDYRFHHGIVESCANQTLIDLVEHLWKLRYQAEFRKFEEHYRALREPALVLREHQAIFEALRAADPNAARTAMHQHLDRIRQQFIK